MSRALFSLALVALGFLAGAAALAVLDLALESARALWALRRRHP